MNAAPKQVEKVACGSVTPISVLADKCAVRVRRQGGLPGAAEPEEYGGVAFGSDIRRAMHRHDAPLWQDEIEQPEDRFLHLAGIGSAANQNDLLAEIDGDDGLAAAA